MRFEYVLEFDQASVHYEALFHYPAQKRRRIFERAGQDLKLQRGLGNLAGIRELLTRRSLALSIARRFDEPMISAFADKLPQMVNRKACEPGADALALLRMADLGIDDFVLDDRAKVLMLHRTADGAAPLSYGQESSGTRAWFELIHPVLDALSGSVALLDDLSATLHPTLSIQLIRLFTDPRTNPNSAQLTRSG